MAPVALLVLMLAFLGLSGAAATGTAALARRVGANRVLAILLGFVVAPLIFIAMVVALYATYNGKLPGIC